MYQVSLVENFLRKNKIENCILYGGYDEAERKMLFCYPERISEDALKEEINNLFKVVRIMLSSSEIGKYTHRNYLGGIVKLGFEREKVGDIIVSKEGADIITKSEFAKILHDQLPSLIRFENSKISIENIQNLKKQEITMEIVKIIVPSLRLDNFVSDLAKTSRSKAAQIINQERVFINGQNETKLSKQVKLNDIINIRGKGRFVIKEFGGSTRSGRTVVVVEKYS